MIITFTDDEMEQIHRLAMIRHKSAGVAVPPKFSKLTAYEIDLLGAMGEAAVAKHFEWAVSTMLFSNIDDGIDFKTSIGSIQVKTAADYRQKNFYQQKTEFPADFGVYARLTEAISPEVYARDNYLGNSIELVGWFYAETWNAHAEEVTNDSGRSSYRLSTDWMNPKIDELVHFDDED